MILQSFFPLFLLLAIKYVDFCEHYSLVEKFFNSLKENGISTIGIAINHSALGGIIIAFISMIWLLVSVIVAIGFNGMQKGGFSSRGETIIILENHTDSGASFLVTYILPLLTDTIADLRDLLGFIVMLVVLILLLSNSNTFYQNPVLVALKYRTFSFKFLNPANDILEPENVFIGITHGEPITENAAIIRKYVSDNIYIIYNEK